MKKRILSLAAVLVYAAVSVFGSSNVFAESNYTQRVALKPYQPAVGNLVYDDDFNDVLITGEQHDIDSNSLECRTTQSEYNVPTISQADGYKLDDSSADVSISHATWEFVYLPKAIKSNKLVVSFDIYATEVKGLGYRFVNKGQTTNMAFYFNAWATGAELSYSTNSKFKAWYDKAPLEALLNRWVNNTLIFERVLNSDGTGYDVYLREFYLDGVKYDTSTLAAATDIDWWTDDPNTNNFYLQAINAGRYLDNVLVYAPAVNEVEVPNTQVKVPSYLPNIGTLVLDESFESSTASGSTVTSDYQYSLKDFAQDTSSESNQYGLVIDGENKYGTFNIWDKIYPKVTGPVDSDRFVISLDAKCSVQNGFNIYFDGNTTDIALRWWFETYADDDSKLRLFLCSGSSTSAKVAEAKLVNKNEFINISVVCKKVNVNGEDKAILSEAYINSDKLTLLDDTNTRYFTTNWFSTAEGTWPVAIGKFTAVGAAALDNILVYAPFKFKASGAELSNDGSSAEITFSDTIGNVDGAAVIAIDALGNTVSSKLSAAGNKLTATFAQPVNVNDKVYTLRVSGVKNTGSDIAPDYTKVYGTGVAGFDFEKQLVYISNNSNVAINGKLIIAAYNGNQLLGISTAPVNNVAVDTVVPISNGSIPETSTTPTLYKLFIWDGFDNAKPYCSSLEYPMQ